MTIKFNYDKLSEIKNVSNCIYKIINTVNGKIYIGKTQAPLILRIRKHCCEVRKGTNRYLCDAIRHYNWDNFTVEVIETCSSDEELPRGCSCMMSDSDPPEYLLDDQGRKLPCCEFDYNKEGFDP